MRSFDRLALDPKSGARVMGGVMSDGSAPHAVFPANGERQIRVTATAGGELWVGGDKGLLAVARGDAFELKDLGGAKEDIVGLSLAEDRSDGLAVDRDGTVYRKRGDAWPRDGKATEGGPAWMPRPGEAWVGGGKISHLREGGWQAVSVEGMSGVAPSLDSELVNAIHGRRPDDVWMVGSWGAVLRYDGAALAPVSKHVALCYARHIAPIGGGRWVSLCYDEGTAITGDASAVQRAPSVGRYVRGPWVTAAGEVVAVDWKSLLFREGEAWTREPAPEGARALGGASRKSLVAVGDDGVAWRLEHGTWRKLSLGTKADLHAVGASADGSVWIVGDGVVFHDGKKAPLPADWDYTAVHVRAKDDVWIAASTRVLGQAGAVVHWDGKAFQKFEKITPNLLDGVYARGPADVWAVGLGGFAAHFDGAKWRLVESGTSVSLFDVWVDDAGRTIALGDGCAVLVKGTDK
jgi:hypothetical protein